MNLNKDTKVRDSVKGDPGYSLFIIHSSLIFTVQGTVNIFRVLSR